MINTEEKLVALLPKLHAAEWVALDTEADSLHAYPEKVCLIQISIAGEDNLVDPLAKINLDPLLDALNAHELIFHAADYDLRLLEKHHQFTPSAIFDTMIAARLLGERQFGLSALVEKFVGVKLDKGMQKADWAQRPLTVKMEEYARNDTRHLKPLSDKLKAELQSKNRLAWHQESCARLVAECSQSQAIDPDLVWRIKGSSRLNRPALAVLREIWKWREDEAVRANRPPFFILSHERLVGVAVASVENQSVENFLPHSMSVRRRENLFAAIKIGLSILPENYPEIIQKRFDRPSDAEYRRFRALEKTRDGHATLMGIDPTLIASKSMLGDLARNWDKHAPDLMSWQRELLK